MGEVPVCGVGGVGVDLLGGEEGGGGVTGVEAGVRGGEYIFLPFLAVSMLVCCLTDEIGLAHRHGVCER